LRKVADFIQKNGLKSLKNGHFYAFAGFTEAFRLKLRRIENAKTVTATTECAA
jgi:hypothetical protein